MKDKIFGVLQRVGRSFMLPIALLPVAGLINFSLLSKKERRKSRVLTGNIWRNAFWQRVFC